MSLNLKTMLGSPQVIRWNQASAVKDLEDVTIPKLRVWNYGPCEYHEVAKPDCEYRLCGGNPFKHQNVTATYSYMAQKGLVANSTGTGKTNSSLETLALIDHFGGKVKCIAVVPTQAVNQWKSEVERWAPGFKVVAVPPKTQKRDRLETYAGDWQIMVIGYHIFTKDIENIKGINIGQIIVDDIDPALNLKNKTYLAVREMCREAEFVIVSNATSLQMNLLQLYAATSLIGGQEVWGSQSNFIKSFVKREPVTIYAKNKQTGKVERRRTFQTTGYKNMQKFRELFAPMSIRFTYEDIADDVTIPDLVTEQVYFDMSPKQQARYAELQEGVRTILDNKSMPAAQKAVSAMTAFTIGSQICAGTFALKTTDGGYEPDQHDASPKLDWIMGKLTDEWIDQKVVVYSKYRGSIRALQGRLDAAGIGFSTISGAVTDPALRKEEMDRFWTDPNDRVMVISVSGERSLNLQNASILVMWDMQLNPARVTQLAGRVRRAGSKNKKVFVFELLHRDSQEERYMAALATRQTLFDYVYEIDNTDDDSDSMLIEKLDPEQILRFIQP